MNIIRKNNGNIIKDNSEILKETMLFYKGLYAKKTVQGVDLNNMLHSNGIPQVEERDKERLEGPITYEELLFCLKKGK